jgi:hypothetical protein
VAAQRLRVGELAAAVVALVPPPVAGRRSGGGRRRRVGAAGTVAARRRLRRVGFRLHLRPLMIMILLGHVEPEELQPGACHTHDCSCCCCFALEAGWST